MQSMTVSEPTAPRPSARLTWGSRRARFLRNPLLLTALLLGVYGCEGCSRSRGSDPGTADAGTPPAGLSPERAAQVLARVGQRSITLGDYAAALERMDPFERMRYQSQDRRQALLDEMINVELLAREAERRGLDRRPETIELVRQFQRDESLRRLRASLPHPEDLSTADVSGYYETHRADFFEPERRRAAHIVFTDESLARRVLAQAQGSSAERWRELVTAHAPGAADAPLAGDKTTARPGLQVPGDLGMLSRTPLDPEESAVGEPLRQALFEIAEVGQVHPRVIAEASRFHVLRLVSRVEARQRMLAEVDALIRTRLVQERQAAAEAALIARLRRDTKVSIDESMLERLPEPPASTSASAAPVPPAAVQPPGDALRRAP
jgi:peptidyl-prolyl cis-trans isomerase C